jgi:transposase
MMGVNRIGLDLAKNIFEIHGVDGGETVVVRGRLNRDQVLEDFGQLPPCLVCIEACGGAHTWAQRLRDLGHDVRLMAPQVIAARRTGGGVADAQAICDAAAGTRATLRVVLASIFWRAWRHQHRTPIELGIRRRPANYRTTGGSRMSSAERFGGDLRGSLGRG